MVLFVLHVIWQPQKWLNGRQGVGGEDATHVLAGWLGVPILPTQCVNLPSCVHVCVVVVLQLGGTKLAGVGVQAVARGCGLPNGSLEHTHALQVSRALWSFSYCFKIEANGLQQGEQAL